VFEIVLLATTGILTALLAGLFFGYAVSVNGGLRRLDDIEYVRAMQSINLVIQNPVFFITFMGPVFLLPATIFVPRAGAEPTSSILLAIASVIYIVGVFGTTVIGNVPLNEKLAKCDSKTAPPEVISSARKAFEAPWNYLHVIRTGAAIAATTLLFIAYLM
jgi:uncharacterized membrane protein